MNTLDIARIMNKRHSNVKRDIIAVDQFDQLINLSVWNSDTKRNTIAYELSSPQIEELPYGELLISKIDNESLRKENELLRKELENKDFINSDKIEIKINQQNAEIEILKRKNEQLKDQLMMKDTQYQGVITDNDVLRESNKDLVVNYKIAQKYVSNAKRAMAIRGDVIENFLRLQEGDKSKPIDIQEWKKLRGMLHPDKLMQNQSKPFQYINEIINR